MLVLPGAPVKMVPGLELRFPESACCNCGGTTQLRVLSQDTRVTRYMVLGGSEITFRLPLPFCDGCHKSAKRRPGGWFHKVLLLALIFGVSALALILGGDAILPSAFIAEHIVALAGVIAVLVTVVSTVLRRPSGNQTSFHQPVRITRLRQKFVSGTVKGIRLAFTNPRYAAEFSRLNAAAIQNELIEVAAA